MYRQLTHLPPAPRSDDMIDKISIVASQRLKIQTPTHSTDFMHQIASFFYYEYTCAPPLKKYEVAPLVARS